MTEAHRQPEQHGPEFERRDLHPAVIYGSLIGLAVATIAVILFVRIAYNMANSYIEARQPKNPMVAPEANTRDVTPRQINQFAQPRLETSERTEINQFRLQEEQRLHSYGWVDQPAGVAYIPIDRAMQLIAQRGLNTTPKAGEYPPSTINTVNQAVQKVDTSNKTPQGGKAKQ
ncbi:MAG TPA: hypothetical protein VF753_17890 [Terriglobales bacterium]